MPSKLESAFDAQRKSKLGIDRLELSTPNPRAPIDLTEPVNTESQYAKEHMAKIRAKYGVQGLDVVGLATRQAPTLADAVRERDRAELKDMKLATAQVQYQGKPMRLWYSITRQ